MANGTRWRRFRFFGVFAVSGLALRNFRVGSDWRRKVSWGCVIAFVMADLLLNECYNYRKIRILVFFAWERVFREVLNLGFVAFFYGELQFSKSSQDWFDFLRRWVLLRMAMCGIGRRGGRLQLGQWTIREGLCAWPTSRRLRIGLRSTCGLKIVRFTLSGRTIGWPRRWRAYRLSRYDEAERISLGRARFFPWFALFSCLVHLAGHWHAK